MNFKTNDKVVCIRPGVDINLVKDKVYTVLLTFTDAMGSPAVELDEVRPPYPHLGYMASRFRKTIDKDLKIVNLKKETSEF